MKKRIPEMNYNIITVKGILQAPLRIFQIKKQTMSLHHMTAQIVEP